MKIMIRQISTGWKAYPEGMSLSSQEDKFLKRAVGRVIIKHQHIFGIEIREEAKIFTGGKGEKETPKVIIYKYVGNYCHAYPEGKPKLTRKEFNLEGVIGQIVMNNEAIFGIKTEHANQYEMGFIA